MNYIERYKKIVGKYSDVIKAQLFGHVQSVEVRVPPAKPRGSSSSLSADESFQLIPLFMSGSISPYFINNPSFMVWDYDADTYEVVDFTVYGTHISEKDQKLDWQRLFKGSEYVIMLLTGLLVIVFISDGCCLVLYNRAYGLKSLTTSDLTEFYERVKTNGTLLDAYYVNMRAQSKRFKPCASDLCRANTLCAMKWWTTKGEYLACVDGVQSSIQKTPPSAVGANASLLDDKYGNEQARLDHDSSIALIMVVCAAVVVVAVAAAIVRRLRRARSSSDATDQRDYFFDSVSPIVVGGRVSGASMHI